MKKEVKYTRPKQYVLMYWNKGEWNYQDLTAGSLNTAIMRAKQWLTAEDLFVALDNGEWGVVLKDE